MVFISTEYIKSIFENSEKINYFVNLSGKTALVIPTFLILKHIGINKNKSIDYNEEKAFAAVYFLHSAYLSSEPNPTQYVLINPFDRNITNRNKKYKWRKESVSEFIRQGGNGFCNNYVGGGIQWDSILDTRGKSPIRFNVNYIKRIKELCGINYQNRIDLVKLSAWCFKENQFTDSRNNNSAAIQNEIVENFIGFFNLNGLELKELFYDSGERIQYSENLVNMNLIRNQCFNLMEAENFVSENRINYKEIRKRRRGIYMSRNPNIKDIIDLLKSRKQIILYGPPGVGKTWIANQIAKSSDNFKITKIIQFHQNYGFEHFIGGYFPRTKRESQNSDSSSDEIEVIYKEGIMLEMVNSSKKEQSLLVIDEINRGNISKIFGETIMTLDREYEVMIKSHPDEINLRLPKNLHILGTMNSTDRSIALVDFALRRRFSFVRLEPDVSVIRDFYKQKTRIECEKTFDLIDVFQKINDRIENNPSLGPDYKIGHSYFLLKKKNLESFEEQFTYSILPILEEYSYGNPNILLEILGNDLVARVKGKDFLEAIIKFLES